MSAVLVDATELDRLNRRMAEYVKASKRTTSYLLDKKGNDLRIALFQEFKEAAWSKTKSNRKSIAFKEFAQRVQQGVGTLVRIKQVMPQYQIPTEAKGTGRKLNWYQRAVMQELIRRTMGIGVLAASFLTKRYRFKGGERYTADVKLKNGQKAITIIKTDEAFQIDGFTPGMGRVAERRGILGKAMRKVSDDIDVYFAKKHADVLERLIAGDKPDVAVQNAVKQ